MMTSNHNKTQNVTLTANIYAEFTKNLKFRSTFGVKYDSNDYRSFNPLYHFSVYNYNDTRTTVNQSKSDGWGITWTNMLTYKWSLGQHDFDAMLDTEAYRSQGSSLYAANGSLRTGFDSWTYAWVSNGTASSTEKGVGVSGSPWDEERMISEFGRLIFAGLNEPGVGGASPYVSGSIMVNQYSTDTDNKERVISKDMNKVQNFSHGIYIYKSKKCVK